MSGASGCRRGHRRRAGAIIAACAAVVLLTGCSGSGEDVRVTFCKGLVVALLPDASEVAWGGVEYAFNRPAFADTRLTFEATAADGTRRAMTAACRYAYEKREQMPSEVGNPILAYATVPFAMTLDGQAVPEAEFRRLVRAEQAGWLSRLLDRLWSGARDLASQSAAGIGG